MGFFWTNEGKSNLNTSEYKQFSKRSTIYKYDSAGQYVKTYESVDDIISEQKVVRATVNRAIQGKYKLRGFYYSLEKVDKFDIPEKASIRNKKVYLYDLDGNFYKEFDSPIDCAKYFGQKSSSAISSAIRLNRAYKGYQVAFEKCDRMKKMSLNNQKQRVLQYDLSGNLVKTYDSITAAINEHGQGVKRVIQGLNKHCHNYIFKLES